MGVDYWATTLIGCKVRNAKITERVRQCDHEETSTNFCGKCGKLLWKVETILNPLFEEGNKIADYEVVHADDEIFVGKFHIKTDSNRSGGNNMKKSELPDIIHIWDIKRDLKALLGNSYSEKDFGLFSIMQCG